MLLITPLYDALVPVVAVEFARKVIYSFNRPSNAEMEEACKQAKNAIAA